VLAGYRLTELGYIRSRYIDFFVFTIVFKQPLGNPIILCCEHWTPFSKGRVSGTWGWLLVLKISIWNAWSLDPGVYSASNRKEYQNQKNNVSGE
jgi:hypothetical protein